MLDSSNFEWSLGLHWQIWAPEDILYRLYLGETLIEAY